MTVSSPERPGAPPAATRGGDPRATRVKICGLTNLADARAALDAGADWLGFVVHTPSPRHIEPERAAGIISALPGVTAVAVMVAVTPEEALEVARLMRAARVQIHRAGGGWPVDFPLPVALAIPVDASGALLSPLPEPAHLLMLDTAHPEWAGGTGTAFPWEAARAHARQRDVLLAGGLSPDNVAAAIEEVRPFGVDASSSLETSPGVKDAARIRRFIAAVRAADRALTKRRA